MIFIIANSDFKKIDLTGLSRLSFFKNKEILILHEVSIWKRLFKKLAPFELISHAHYPITLFPPSYLRPVSTLINKFCTYFYKELFFWLIKLFKKDFVLIIPYLTWEELARFPHKKIVLFCPNLDNLKSQDKIESIEMLRQIAVRSKMIYTQTAQDKKEMLLFNKKVNLL